MDVAGDAPPTWGWDLTEIEDLLNEAVGRAKAAGLKGRLPDYIPELARIDPKLMGIAAHTVEGEAYASGDAGAPFTLQSVSKVFALAAVMRETGTGALADMPGEPSGDAFHSIVRLEEESGRPRNPLINAGAILVSSRLAGPTPEAKARALRAFIGEIAGAGVEMDRAVYESERATGFRNRALANYMRHFRRLDDAEGACEAYFRQCAIRLDARALARAGLFLANRGRDPVSGREILPAEANRTVLALMLTCGLYDQVGEFAVKVGVPAKSAVSGAILAVVPGRMAIATYAPLLGEKGNSLAGMAMLEFLSDELGLSVFG